MRKLSLLTILLASIGRADLVSDVKAIAATGNLDAAAQLVRGYSRGVETPESLLASSWIARTALSLKRYDQATAAAKDTYTKVRANLSRLPIGADPEGPVALALGAAIEVQAQAMAAQGSRGDALAYLQHELDLYRATSIRARIQKNVNLLGLEGKTMPALRGMSVPSGKPSLVFFWAHWCTDCRAEAPILDKLKREFPTVSFLGPTQRYGYISKGTATSDAQETAYIELVRRQFYANLVPAPAVVNEENFASWGVSTTPTLVLIDKAGKVAQYHPGNMSEAELRAALTRLTH